MALQLLFTGIVFLACLVLVQAVYPIVPDTVISKSYQTALSEVAKDFFSVILSKLTTCTALSIFTPYISFTMGRILIKLCENVRT